MGRKTFKEGWEAWGDLLGEPVGVARSPAGPEGVERARRGWEALQEVREEFGGPPRGSG